MKKDYVEVIYDENKRPQTIYPGLLARYLFRRFGMKSGDRFLEIGCGRGEFLRGFIECGVDGFGVDRSRVAERYCSDAHLSFVDLEKDSLPYQNDSFDVVYSKSVIEHFYYPEKIFQEIYRVLKPGGLAVTLCPDWEYNYRIYFEDFTHRTPFMQSSLHDIQAMHGFVDIKVEKFRQLPILWEKPGAFLLPFAEITRLLAPDCLKAYCKWVRFSKEIMLLSSSFKPLETKGCC